MVYEDTLEVQKGEEEMQGRIIPRANRNKGVNSKIRYMSGKRTESESSGYISPSKVLAGAYIVSGSVGVGAEVLADEEDKPVESGRSEKEPVELPIDGAFGCGEDMKKRRRGRRHKKENEANDLIG